MQSRTAVVKSCERMDESSVSAPKYRFNAARRKTKDLTTEDTEGHRGRKRIKRRNWKTFYFAFLSVALCVLCG
jgi:hypothetical protein